jgi:8-oxo-dGTP diphosphatase
LPIAAGFTGTTRHPTLGPCEDEAVQVDPDRAEVRAAGGVVCRPTADGALEVAVTHRPKYDDWSLPKGKLHDGECFEAAALREVEEEIGVRCRLGRELEPVGYDDPKGRWKVVRYWVMEPVEEYGFEPNEEVDAMGWLSPDEATALLTHAHDAELVRQALR